MTVEISQVGQAPSSPLPEDCGLQTARGDLRAVQRRRVHGGVPVPPHAFPHDPQNIVHRVSDYWRNVSYSALRYQQEQVENAVQEHERVVYEQDEIAAAVATSRTAAQISSRFTDIKINDEANIRQQQQGMSDITSESAQALEAQRHCFVNSRDDAERHPQQVVSQLRRELQHDLRHAKGQPDECQQSPQQS